MIKKYNITCPVVGQKVAFTVTYIETGTFDNSTPEYIKGRFECSHSKICKSTSKCPLYEASSY